MGIFKSNNKSLKSQEELGKIIGSWTFSMPQRQGGKGRAQDPSWIWRDVPAYRLSISGICFSNRKGGGKVDNQGISEPSAVPQKHDTKD